MVHRPWRKNTVLEELARVSGADLSSGGGGGGAPKSLSFLSMYPWDLVSQGCWGTGPNWGWCSFRSWVKEALPLLMKSAMRRSLQSTRMMWVADIEVRARRSRDDECRETGSCRWGQEMRRRWSLDLLAPPHRPPEPQPGLPWLAPSGGCPPATKTGGSAIPRQ